MDDMFGIQESMQQVTKIAEEQFPIQLAKLAREIFDSAGTTHGRNWTSNRPSTVKKKGFDHRNTETGELGDYLSTPGVLLDDDFMENLPVSPRSKSSNGYLYANDDGKFEDIGQTEDDLEFVAEQMARQIAQNYRG